MDLLARRRRTWHLFVAALFALSCSRQAAAPPNPAKIREIENLLPQSVGEVELRGVVTYFDVSGGVLYLQDPTGAQAFEVGDLGAPVVIGQSVVLAGALQPGAALPRLTRPRVTVLGQSSPDVELVARRIGLPALMSREAAATWVEVRAVVRSAVREGESLVLEVEEEGVRARAVILSFADPRYPEVVGARLRLSGVSTVRAHPWGDRPPMDLLVPTVDSVRIEEDAPATPEPLAATLPVLTSAQEVRGLSPAEAAKGYPIRLRAVVTYNDPEEGLFFVQDASGGIYVESWRHIHPARPGDRVEVDGRSAPGAFAPIVDRPRVRILGSGPLPQARSVRPGQLTTGAEDSQFVEVEGIVRTIRFDRYGATLHVADGKLRFPVRIPDVTDRRLAERLVDARIRVRGTCRSILTVANQLADVVLHTPDLDSLEIVSLPHPDPQALVVRPVSTLLQFHPGAGQGWEHRVRVQGVVTYSQQGQIYIQDDTGAVFVRSPSQRSPGVGDHVDVVGFTAPGEYKPVLEDAEVSVLERRLPPTATTISPEHGLSGRFDASLVTLEARLLDMVRGDGEQQLSMRAGPYLFTAILRGAFLPEFRPGSQLRLSGICTLGPTSDLRVPQAFRVLLRAPGDVVVLRAAPWWNPQHAAWALAVMAAGVGLSLAWVTTLRRRVRAQSAVIWERVKRETELQERQRMARELHDTLEQNLAGIGLCLEAASRALPARVPVAEQHLALAVEQVNAGVDEVRRSVWALRASSLEASGLAAALDEIAQQLARCSAAAVEVRTRVVGQAGAFALSVENDLLRIGQEALTNAVRHGGALHLDIELRYEPDAFRLRIADDGRGFDAQIPLRPGHFGLMGMRERAEMIGAQLEIRSTTGRGTEIVVTVPRKPLALLQVG